MVNIKTKHILFFLLYLGLSSNIYSQNGLKSEYTYGISNELFDGVNARDARASLELWAKVFVDSYDEVENAKIIILNDTQEIITSTNNKSVDLVMLSSLLYVMEEAKLNLEPMIISKLSSDLFFSLVLCSNSASSEKVESFSDLRNKSILVQGGKFKRLTELWLDLLCLQVGEKDKYKFFNKIEFVEKPMQAVLPVFFNKTDLCIVNNVALDAIIDLNPQIKKSLKVIFKRDNLINEMTFVRKDLDKNAKEIIKSRGLNYKSLPNGEQIFKIFKSFDSAVFKPSDLDGVKSLFKEYQRLKSSTKN